MNKSFNHPYPAKISFDGGNLDCGNGLLLKIRKHIDQLESGELLEILSVESSVEEDLPAWCRLTKNELVSFKKVDAQRSFLVSKGIFDPLAISHTSYVSMQVAEKKDARQFQTVNTISQKLGTYSVCGIGSWPRPTWLITALHSYLEGKMSEDAFQNLCDDAIRECVNSQISAGADIITDGELRRDNYASFVALKLENCQLIPLVDLLPIVNDPEKFSLEMAQLDVPADKVRHPAVFGKIKRKESFCLNEALFLKSITEKPIKVSLPGPYLLSRTMWMECIPHDAYQSRDELAQDIVSVLREELSDLISHGVELIQFDEPILTEVVFHPVSKNRTFMCGALSEKKSAKEELEFASRLLQEVIKGFDAQRIALHICRGNWTKDETKALQGPYDLLAPYFDKISVGTLFLEYATSRAGDYEFLKKIKDRFNLGIGFINQKREQTESIEDLKTRSRNLHAILSSFKGKLLFTPDCGFSTFADSPLCSNENAAEKISRLVEVKEYYESL